ncbi:MAG: toprim domain-containing protein [Bacillota bacterium]
MSGKKSSYDNDSIVALKGAERVRKRPSVIFGSDGLKGAQHSFFEILSNSIDEAREGHGNLIEVVLHNDKSITIKDNGRGIPLDYNEREGKYNWELIYCELYAGGKYDDQSSENYEYSLGLNGLGACATQYSSEFMEVTVYREGYKFELEFEKGKNVGGLKKTKCDYDSPGTIQRFKPDLDVFTSIDISIDYFKEVLKKQAVVNSNVRFILKDEQSEDEYEFFYKNGIKDYIEEINDGKNFTDKIYLEDEGMGKDRKDKPEYKTKFELVMMFNNNVNRIEHYHNSSFLEHGGSPNKAIRTALVYELDKFIKKENKYKKNEKRVTFSDIEDSLILITNSFSTVTSYENQTKKAITNKFIKDFIKESLRQYLEIFFIENKMTMEKIIDQVLINKRSREKAEKTRKNIKKKLSKSSNNMKNRVKKYVGCRSKKVDKRELFILEGDSALGACKLARDAKFQALMPIRGKILNCLKADYNRIFKSKIIMDLLKVIGCGVEIKSKHSKKFSTFDIDELPWSKIIITTDADVDGYQIRTLILAMFYRLLPSLIEEGKIYIAETPLFEIKYDNKIEFAYNEKEKREIIKKIDSPYKILRSKGLGENDPEMLWETTMAPKTRRLIKVVPEDVKETKNMFDTLLGKELAKRKKFIAKFGEKYLDMIDVS